MPIYSQSVGLATVGASVVSRIADRDNRREEIQAQSAEAKLRTNKADALNDPDLIKKQVKEMNTQLQKVINEGYRQKTIDQFRLFLSNGNDPRHLTNLFKNNERIRKQFGDIVSIERLDPEKDLKLLTDKGLKLEDYRPSSHFKAIMPNGQDPMLFDAYGVAVGTGALLAIMHERADLVNKWSKANGKDGRKFSLSEIGKVSSEGANLGLGTGETYEDREKSIFQMQLIKKEGGIEPGKQNLADESLFKMVDSVGGDQEWFNMDFSKEENRILVARDFRKYKALGGIDISDKQKTDIVNLSKLVSLAGTVGDKLTPKVTGIYDTFLRDIRKYISDNVDEVDKVSAQSAYEAFRSMFRHAIAGTALTDNEIELFNDAYGKISFQYPQVAAQFMIMLDEVKSKLQTIAQLEDPYLAHYYLGSKMNNVNGIIDSINQRIELISQAQGNEPGKFADATRENVGDEQVVIPNDPAKREPVDPTTDPNASTDSKLQAIFEQAFGK